MSTAGSSRSAAIRGSSAVAEAEKSFTALRLGAAQDGVVRLRRRIVVLMPSPLRLIEFPADDPDRARSFWTGVLGVELVGRSADEGQGWQTRGDHPTLGVHERGRGPGDTNSLPYFEVADLQAALERVRELGGEVVHPGSRWAVCRDSEGSPFGLAESGLQAGDGYGRG